MDNIISGGKSPEFLKPEIAKAKELKETTPYWQDAYRFLIAFLSRETPWEMMSKKQRMWLWKIKDDVEAAIKREREAHNA